MAPCQLNAQIGLFKVTDGIYQVRGFDVANMTLIGARAGWIVVDTLTCRESAAAALAFARKHLGDKPVSAVIFTHSHIDHFGGALGVCLAQEVARAEDPRRRLRRIHGGGDQRERDGRHRDGPALDLPVRQGSGAIAQGQVDTGLGKAVAYGTFGILQPTQLITQPTQEMMLDGVRFVFHNVPGAEAPAEMTFCIPELKAYGGAENLAQTMHNLLPVRGAKVRDALRWANYMQQALDQARRRRSVLRPAQLADLGPRAHRRVHHEASRRLQVHPRPDGAPDQRGLTPREIADKMKLPPSLRVAFGARGYYGDLRHNVKAVYQFYLAPMTATRQISIRCRPNSRPSATSS